MPDPSTDASRDTGLAPGDAFEVHRQMVFALFLATLILCVALVFGLLRSSYSALIVVAGAGALGGFVSALRRLYAFQRIFPIQFFTVRKMVDPYLIIYSMIPALVGGIAAVTIYLVFASGLVKGGMFPEFHQATVNPGLTDFQNFVDNFQPVGSTDYAKALVWAFIAGFSERFVPDLLERFASSQREAKSEPPPVDQTVTTDGSEGEGQEGAAA